ncbi:MAG: insulinase family protein [Myxococcota bacterium]|nr:insulinase family protein [Myxococcota bacterium]
MAQRFRLDNGLTVIFEEQHAAKVAAFQVWVKAGSADERPDQAGIAHLHEHMLFKGTARRGPGQIAHEVEAAGGHINAWTSFDQTVYHVVMASRFARTGLDVLADAIRHSSFDPGELAREIEVVVEEINRGKDNVGRRASRALYETAFPSHPYGQPVIGSEESVRSFTREKVLDFYQSHYAPQNTVLVAVGDLEPGELKAWSEELLGGDWGRRYPGKPARPVEPPRTGQRIRLLEDPSKELHLGISFPGPDARHPDNAALDVLAMIYGQGDTSRLSLELKRSRRWVNAAGAYSYTALNPGVFAASLSLAPEHALEAFEEMLLLARDLTVAEVTPDELETVKAIFEAEAVYQKETVQGQARKLGMFETTVGGIEAEAAYYDQVAALTPQALRAVASKYLRLDQVAVSGLVPVGAPLTEGQVRQVLDQVAKTDRPPRAFPRPARTTPGGRLQLTAAKARGDSGVLVETLPSGARLIIREESAVPLFAMRAAYLGGVRFEDDAHNGLTTLLARTLTRGTAQRSAEAVSHLVDDLAGSLSGSGGRNSVGARGEFLSKHFQSAFGLFSEILNQPSFTEEEVDRERKLMLEDLRSRDDKPAAIAFELFSRALYQQHPYRLPSQGDETSVAGLQPSDLLDYHARFMDPSQLTLAVVGDVKADEVRELANQAFGKSRGRAAAAPTLPVEPARTGPSRVEKLLPLKQTHLVAGFQGARMTDAWRWPLEVLSTVLSGQGGRLFMELRDKRSMAYSVTSYAVDGIEPGYFAVYIGTSPDKEADALEGIRAELSKVCETPITEAELERAKRNLIGGHEIGLQRNGARAGLLGLDYLYNLGGRRFEHYGELVEAITAREVMEAARRVIDLEKMVLARVGP